MGWANAFFAWDAFESGVFVGEVVDGLHHFGDGARVGLSTHSADPNCSDGFRVIVGLAIWRGVVPLGLGRTRRTPKRTRRRKWPRR